jgi:hypothetical protein
MNHVKSRVDDTTNDHKFMRNIKKHRKSISKIQKNNSIKNRVERHSDTLFGKDDGLVSVKETVNIYETLIEDEKIKINSEVKKKKVIHADKIKYEIEDKKGEKVKKEMKLVIPDKNNEKFLKDDLDGKKDDVQVYNYKANKSRVVFDPDLVMLGHDEQFTVLSLSGDVPKVPGKIKALALLLGPDFTTDLVVVETSLKL